MAAAITTALSYRDSLQAFTISADELAGRWSTAKARDLLAWNPPVHVSSHPRDTYLDFGKGSDHKASD